MTSSDENPPATGVPFGRYSIRKRIARGGMGEVFLADQLGPLGPVRPVALKRMLPKMARDPHAAKMFLGEMATAAQLNHPNIATTYDFGEVEGVYFLAMEYVEGLSLHQILKNLGPLPVAEVVAITAAVADALAYAHSRKAPDGAIAPVVHRDISPHNVMVSTRGQVKLLDFGIARAEAAVMGGRLQGKIAYAAPEQLQAAPADRRADLWALGVVVYEALTGVRPFESADPAELVAMEFEGRYLALDVRRPEAGPIAAVIARALTYDPDRRWSNAVAFRSALVEASARFGTADDRAIAGLVEQAGGPQVSVLGVDQITHMGSSAGSAPTATVPLPDSLRTPPGRSRSVEVALEAPVETSRLPWKMAASAAGTLALALAVVFAWPTEERVAVQPIDVPASTASVAAGRRIEAPRVAIAAIAAVHTASGAVGGRAIGAVAEDPAKSGLGPPARGETPARAPEILARVSGEAPAKTAPAKVPVRRPVIPAAEPAKPALSVEGLGLLSVRTIPWARVSLDGKHLGNSPLANLPVRSGVHTLTLIPGAGEAPPQTVEINVHSGAVTKVVHSFGSGAVSVDPPR